jgi:hypothetical protein
MNIKHFLKPDWRKIVIFVVLFIAIFLIGYYKYLTLDSWTFGIPFEFSSGYGPCPYPNVIECNKNNFIFLVLDIIIWYILSCLIIWVYDKFRKK